MNRQAVLRWICSGVLLLLGTAIYLIWRPNVLFGGRFAFISDYVHIVQPEQSWILYSLPDALWYGSLLLSQPFLTKENVSTLSGMVIVLAMVIPFIHEVGQKIRLFPGVYCWEDMIAYSIILIIYLIVTLCLIKFRKDQ